MTPYPGMDMASLQQLMQQFQPNDADRRAARQNAILTLGLGLLGARKGFEAERLGQAGLLAAHDYQDQLRQVQAQRMQGMQAANMAMQLREQQQKFADENAMRQALIATAGTGQQSPMSAAMSQAPSLSPTTANVAAVTQAAASTPAPGLYEQLQARGQALMKYGQEKGQPAVYNQGLAMLQAAEKFAPKYRGMETVMQDGKPVVLQTFENRAPQTTQYQPKPDYKSFSTGDTSGFIDPLTQTMGPTFTMNPTPGERMSQQTALSGQAVTMRGQNMADARAKQNIDLRKQELIGPDGPMTPEAIVNAAARYNIDGTLPPMGMGLTAAGYRSAILNEAARQAQAQGLTPEAQRGAQIANKGNTQAYGQIAKQEAMVGAFEKNFTKNADLALQQSAKVDRTGVPIVNKWINAGKRAVTGDPDLSAFDAVLKATVNEYSKIMSGSMGNQQLAEGEIKKVEALLAAAQTPQQVASVISMMKQETANRMSAFAEQKQEIMSNISGRGNSGKTVDFKDLK